MIKKCQKMSLTLILTLATSFLVSPGLFPPAWVTKIEGKRDIWRPER